MIVERLTPRERVLTALAHEKPDRTPLFLWARPEIHEKLKQHFNTESQEEVNRALGIDWDRGTGVGIRFPEFEARGTVPLPGESSSAGRQVILHDDGTYEDAWGIRWRVGSDGKYDEHVAGPLTGPSLEGYKLPTIDQIEDGASAREAVEKHRDQWFVVGGLENPFKRAWHLRGFENFLADLYESPDFVDEFLDRLFDLVTEQGRRLAEAGVDAVMFVGDIAMQDRLIISPDSWRRFFKPRMAEMVQETRKIKKDLYWAVHSDGDLMSVLDDHIEIGFEIINPIQPECMDPAEVKRRYGKRITLHGCGSCQRLAEMSVREVADHVTGIIRACGYDGGLILGPSNALQYDVPVENVLTFFETARNLAP